MSRSIPAPYVSAPMGIETDWIDYNGHLNMAYYNVLFDRAYDQVLALLGLGLDYVRGRKMTIYTAEVHVCYVQELHLDHKVVVSLQLIDHDAKRLRAYQEIRHVDGWLAATSESLALHVDMAGPKAANFPPDIMTRVEAFAAAHSTLPMPVRAGRAIGIKRKS